MPFDAASISTLPWENGRPAFALVEVRREGGDVDPRYKRSFQDGQDGSEAERSSGLDLAPSGHSCGARNQAYAPVQVNVSEREGMTVMETGKIRFEFTTTEGTVRLKPDNPAALEQLTFRHGSEVYGKIMKALAGALRKEGFVRSTEQDDAESGVDPYAILTGRHPVAWRFAQPSARKQIDLPPICFACDANGCRVVDCWF